MKRLFWILRNQRGQVPDVEPPAGDPPSGEPPPADPPEGDGGDDPEQSGKPEESFIDPSQLPEELKPHWKAMHASFTKRMADIRAGKEKLAAYDRFLSDPDYAKAVIADMAPRIGLNLGTPPAPGKTPETTAESAPPELLEAVKAQLAPELQWMAPSIANAQWAANRVALEPLKQKQESDTKAKRAEEFQSLATELSEVAPTWEDQETEMSELLSFLTSDKLRHPKFGSKLALLYNAVSGNAAATQGAVNRMSSAARARTSTSRVQTRTVSNISERIKGARTEAEAWEIAAKDALEKHKLKG